MFSFPLLCLQVDLQAVDAWDLGAAGLGSDSLGMILVPFDL
jgi:hypothetical protein